ncbi:hypothetical protein V6N13_033377 [Hibiscus sabdariffa]
MVNADVSKGVNVDVMLTSSPESKSTELTRWASLGALPNRPTDGHGGWNFTGDAACPPRASKPTGKYRIEANNNSKPPINLTSTQNHQENLIEAYSNGEGPKHTAELRRELNGVDSNEQELGSVPTRTESSLAVITR